MHALTKSVFVLFGFLYPTSLTRQCGVTYTSYQYGSQKIFHHNGFTRTPNGPYSNIQCANACSRSGAGLCTAFTLTNGRKCVFYGGWLHSHGTGTPITGGLYVERLLTVSLCADDMTCLVVSRHKVQRSLAAAACSSLGGGKLPSPNELIKLACFFGDSFDIDIWIGAARDGPSNSDLFYWEDTGQEVWFDADLAQVPSDQEACVYYKGSTQRLDVAPCSSRLSYVCVGVPSGAV